MCETMSKKPEKTVDVVRGQLHKFMLLPVMEHHADWFDAGPVTFAVEARVIGNSKGEIAERGASIHVFDAERRNEYARFDCFEGTPHYHFILNDVQHNVVWGYDPVINGPMLAWSLGVIRDRLPDILREARAPELAALVEREGFDASVLDGVKKAMIAAHARTFPGTDMIDEGLAWYSRWKDLHPEFNTVDD
jgi:hypothetical protein